MFGLVLSKDAKVWCSVWVLGVGAKQGCKARVLSKQVRISNQARLRWCGCIYNKQMLGLVVGAGFEIKYQFQLVLSLVLGLVLNG